MNKNINVNLGLNRIASGLQFRKHFNLSSYKTPNKNRGFKSKFITSQSKLNVNGKNLEMINKELDRLLWEDVFKPYGHIGGFGFSYSYTQEQILFCYNETHPNAETKSAI